MHITVHLEKAVLSDLLAELLPITILLDEDDGLRGRWIRIDRARHLELRPDETIRLVTSGRLRWRKNGTAQVLRPPIRNPKSAIRN